MRAWLNEDPKRSRGEFVLCVGADQSKKKRKAGEGLGAQDVKVLKVLLEAGLSTKDASSIAMKLTSGSKKQLYEEALQIKKTLNIKPIRRKR